MDYSRNIACDNSQGGNSKLYIFPFVQYAESLIDVQDNILVDFPEVTVYDLNATNINFTNEFKEDLYEQTVSFQLKKLSESDKLKGWAEKDVSIIVKDNNNNYRIFGLYTGLIGTYKEESGTNRSDFNGYSFNYSTKEEISAPYLGSLAFFNITDNINLIFRLMTFATYADMIAFGTPTTPIIARVLNDENKVLENTEYRIFPDGTRMWIANTEDN